MLARATLNLGWRRRDTTAGGPLKAGFPLCREFTHRLLHQCFFTLVA
jgi:hypothetical protein